MKYQVLILAGGESSRFFPFNENHKSLFSVAGKTILERVVESVKKLNPSEITLVLGSKNFAEEKQSCESRAIFKNVRFVCEASPLGQADAILSAKEYIKDDFFVINANQLNFHKIAEGFIEKHKKFDDLATLGITKTTMPCKYGVVDMDGDRVKRIVEKPEPGKEPSDMRLVGIYLFSKKFIQELEKGPMSEYSLEECLNKIAQDKKVGVFRLETPTPSLKYPWDLLEMKDFIFSDMEFKKERSAIISKNAAFIGKNIYVGKNAHIYDFAIIEGPAFIGEDAVVGSYSQVRGGTILGSATQIERYADVKNSIIGDGTHLHSGFIGDSVIGKNCRIGAGFITANKRIDRASIKMTVKNKKVDSGRVSAGIFMGDNVNAGIRVSTMPGTIIGEGSVVYPGAILNGCYEKNSKIK